MNPEPENSKQEAMSRKNYSAPSLIIYGAVRSLTQSGTMGWEENWSMGMCIENTMRRPCSERRVKENIVHIGDHPLGFGLYLFDYLPEYRNQWGYGRQFGVMIDEVENVIPAAVSMHSDSYKRVDYSLLGIHRYRH